MADSEVICLACGVFKRELESIRMKNGLDFKIRTIDSMLHINPEKLREVLEKNVQHYPGEKILLLYGDCQPRMHDIEQQTNVSRVAGINCCEILLGKERYREYQRSNAFIFLPEWIHRWREIFTQKLGFKKIGNARDFLKEYCRRFVFLDTGLTDVPRQRLDEIKNYFDLPIEILSIDLTTFENGIREALRKFSKGTIE